MTLTSVVPWQELDPATFRKGMARVIARLRRLYGRVEYFGMVEFTTGQAPSSGGERRMHSHNLLKFRDHDQVDVLDVERVVRETWQKATGAYVVEVAALVSPGAAVGYLALHHRKPEQAAPVGWRGMVERHSEGYFVRPVAELREQARAELQAEAIAWAKGVPVELAAIEVASSSWTLIEVRERPDTGVIEPLGEFAPMPPKREGWQLRRGELVNVETGELWAPPRARLAGHAWAPVDALQRLRVELQELYLADFVRGGD